MKVTERAREAREIDWWDGGTGWIAHPDESMQRASHALVDGDEVWLTDPVDFDGLDDLLADRGTVEGVLVLFNQHSRDADVIARRHDVPVYVPDWMTGVADKIDARVEYVHRDVPGTEYGVHKLTDNPVWKEAVLYGEDSGTLLVPESLGTASYFLTGNERIGVHPARRLVPPRMLRRLSPERILVGHGEGVFEEAEPVMQHALDGARRRTPQLYAKAVREFVL